MREVAAALPSSLRLFQQPPPKIKTAGSCIGQISLFLSLGSPRRTMRMLPLTSHTGTSARLHSAPADGSGAAAGVGTDLSTSSARGPTRAPSAPAAPPRGAPGPAAPSGKTGRDAETRRCGARTFCRRPLLGAASQFLEPRVSAEQPRGTERGGRFSTQEESGCPLPLHPLLPALLPYLSPSSISSSPSPPQPLTPWRRRGPAPPAAPTAAPGPAAVPARKQRGRPL